MLVHIVSYPDLPMFLYLVMSDVLCIQVWFETCTVAYLHPLAHCPCNEHGHGEGHG